MQSGFPLLQTARGGESGFRQEHFEFVKPCVYSHHLPAVEGRFLGRRGEGEERALGRL